MEKVIKGLTKASAADREKKSKKRLQTFITEKNLNKKWKTLVKITEKETGEELRRFYTEQCENIITTIIMFIGTLELSKDKTKKGQESDVMQVFDVLKKCVVLLVVQIKNRWKFQELLGLIKKLLARQNKSSVRTSGFELLLLFTEALLQAEESKEGLDEILDLFARVINFQPFLQEHPTANLVLTPPTADPGLILVPSSSGESIDEAIDQFHMFFEFMTARTGRSMEFWFEQFKARYLTVLYPRTMKEIGYDIDDRTGFSDRCPAPLQCALIEQLDKWKGNVPLTTRLWEERNAPLMFEIVRQGTLLSLRHAATVKRLLFSYRHWFLTKRIREEVQQSYWRLFIGHWVTLFNADPSEAPEEYRGLFTELLSLYNSLSQTNQQMLDADSWHTLQHSILTGTLHLFARLRALRARDAAVDAVAEDVVHHLFLVWIRSPYNSDEMWQKFHESFVSVLDQSHVIRGWKEKIVRLTALLVEYYYTAELTADTEDEPLKETVTKDTMGVAWDETKIKDMWFTILNICGNINNIAVPLNHETAMQCVAEMIDIFIASENKIPLSEQPHKLPLLDIFLPWLLQACYSAPDKQQGLVIAHRVLAKLFCRQHAQPLSIDLLAHFYRVVLNGLSSDREPVRDAVLNSTRLIFSYDLPGSAVLITAYLAELQSLFARNAISTEVQRSATTLLNSLLSYPAHYSAVSYPVPNSDQSWSATELRDRLTALLHHLLSGTVPVDATTRQQVLWGLCVHVFDELRAVHSLEPRMEVVVRSLQLIIEHTRHRDDQVALTACEVLGCMTTLSDEFNALNHDLTYSVIALLTDNIAQLLNELIAAPAAPRDKVINDNFHTLSAWLVSQGNLFLTDPDLNAKIFRLLELALLGQIGTEPIPRSDSETRVSEEEEPDKKKRKDSTRRTMRGSESTPRRSGTLPAQETAMERLMRQPVHGSNSVQQAAELFLATLTNYYNNFPTPAGATMMESFLEDEEDKTVEALFFSHYDRHVLALYPLHDHLVRFVVRTPLGKFAWDCAVDWGDEHVITLARATLPSPRPLASPSRDVPPPCPLSAHLAAMYARHPEALESGAELGAAALGQPRLSGAYSAEIRANRPLLDEQILQDISVQSRTSPRDHVQPPSTEPFSESQSPVSLFSCSRVLLSALGMLSAAHRRELHQLEDSSRLRRALQDLDRVRGREVVKVGVIYVREGQERQHDILCNDEGSAEYHALLRGLGWPVEIQSHAGFKAGLAADGSNGTVTPYYANERYELVYHVVSYMPTKDSDPKQVTKKRHVGNDPVHIVWSEHKRDYEPNVIVSQFNDAHIVVYPLSSGLFRIQVFKKDKLKVIGPLQDGMIVTKRNLADLVRLTAVSAHRAVRYSQKGYEHPFTIRTRYIQEAVRRYKAPRAAEEFMHRLYPLKAEYLKQSATTTTPQPTAPASPRPAALSVSVMPLSMSSSAVNRAPPSPQQQHTPLSRSSSIGPHDTAAGGMPKFNPQVKRPPPPAVKRADSTNNK